MTANSLAQPDPPRTLAYAKGTIIDLVAALVALGVDPYEERICTLDVGFAGSGLVEMCRTSSGVHVREVEAM